MPTLIKNLSKDTFQPYGYIIEHDEANVNSFQVILTEKAAVGWRIAVSKITQRSISTLARHPGTMESFEPISGVTLLCVSLPETPEAYDIFLLDKPVCILQNTWHATMTLSEYSLVKICENNEVDSESYELSGGPIHTVIQAQ